MNEAQSRGRRTLILISLMFIVPIVSAMYMYFSGVTWQPTGSTEHGRLITPPYTLSEETLNETGDSFRKIWSLVVLTGDTCDTVCVTALENIRQVRLSLGPKMPRMQTVLLPSGNTAILAEFAAEHPKLIAVEPDQAAGFRATIGAYENGEVFMVDPLGNTMMRYEPGTSMGDIRKDIAHLFKLSGVG